MSTPALTGATRPTGRGAPASEASCPPPVAGARTGVKVAGLTPFSSVDWPGRLAATVFTQGCPWTCFYCHNPALIDPHLPGERPWSDVMTFLARRRGLLDGVVFSGGEPTMQRGLATSMTDVRELGFPVGLHTGGAYPALLGGILSMVDWIGLDIKAEPETYPATTGRPGSGVRAWASLELVLQQAHDRARTAPLAYEVRTTVYPASWDADMLRQLGRKLADVGVRVWALQRFRSTGVRLDALPEGPAGPASGIDPVVAVAAELGPLFDRLIVR